MKLYLYRFHLNDDFDIYTEKIDDLECDICDACDELVFEFESDDFDSDTLYIYFDTDFFVSEKKLPGKLVYEFRKSEV